MRIALYHNAPSGGAKRAIYEWTRRLTTKHHIDVYTLSSADHAFCDIRPLVQQHHIFEFTPRKLFGSPWGRLNQLQRWRDLGELVRIGERIAQQINASHYDLVFAHTCLYTFIPSCVQFLQTPVIYYLHEPFGPKFMRQFQRPYMKDDQWRQFLNRFDPLIGLYQKRLADVQYKSMYKTRLLLANSHFTKEQMKIAYGIDTPVCHYGVDCDNFRIVPDINKGTHVISVGELSPRKGFDFIVESLGHIPADQRPKLKLACNSVNSLERSYIENMAVEHGVDLQVLTNLNTSELAVEYNKAQLCIYAPVLEPFGLVPVEAMSCGTPVVGVREGGVQESIMHNQTGLLVERDPVQFATAVQHLLSNSKLILEYGRNSREHIVCNWTWDASVAELEKYFLTCVE